MPPQVPICDAGAVQMAMSEGCSLKLSLTVQGGSSLQTRLCTRPGRGCYSYSAKSLYVADSAGLALALARAAHTGTGYSWLRHAPQRQPWLLCNSSLGQFSS